MVVFIHLKGTFFSSILKLKKKKNSLFTGLNTTQHLQSPKSIVFVAGLPYGTSPNYQIKNSCNVYF